MESKLKIDEEFRSLIQPLSPEEHSQLEENLLRDGCLDPLVTWVTNGSSILLDGHNRYEICAAKNIKFGVFERMFPNRDAAKEWIISNQLGRRNLSPDAASVLRGKKYNLAKAAHGGERHQKSENGDIPAENGSSAQNEHLGGAKTADRIADETGVSRETIKRDGQRAVAIDKLVDAAGPEAQAAVLSGDVKMSRGAAPAIAKLPRPALKVVAEMVATRQVESVDQAIAEVKPELTPQRRARARNTAIRKKSGNRTAGSIKYPRNAGCGLRLSAVRKAVAHLNALLEKPDLQVSGYLVHRQTIEILECFHENDVPKPVRWKRAHMEASELFDMLNAQNEPTLFDLRRKAEAHLLTFAAASK